MLISSTPRASSGKKIYGRPSPGMGKRKWRANGGNNKPSPKVRYSEPWGFFMAKNPQGSEYLTLGLAFSIALAARKQYPRGLQRSGGLRHAPLGPAIAVADRLPISGESLSLLSDAQQ